MKRNGTDNNEKTNVIRKCTDTRTNKNCNRGTVLRLYCPYLFSYVLLVVPRDVCALIFGIVIRKKQVREKSREYHNQTPRLPPP